jgi:hypothetical protein
MNNYVPIDDIVSIMKQTETELRRLGKPDIPGSVDLDRGFQVSRAACSQPNTVAMSPWMKNALIKHGDLKDGERLITGAPETSAESAINARVVELLNQINGPKEDGYDESLGLLDKRHYDVDCWRNFKENMRDIQPGQEEMRQEGFDVFTTQAPQLDVYALLNDSIFRAALCVIWDLMPQAQSSVGEEVEIPFVKKQSNVSYPWWYNDRSVYEDGETYGELAVRTARDITDLSELWKYNITTAYGRNQRGKGRPILGTSRVANAVLNRVEAPEISNAKRNPLFLGYNPETDIRQGLVQFATDCTKRKLISHNWDQSKYDQHVAAQLINLIGAMRELKMRDARGKRLCRYRTLMAMKSWLLNGIDHTIKEINGRIFSGFIDTNLGGGWVNALITTYVMMKLDKNWMNKTANFWFRMLVMGDDNLVAYDPSVTREKFAEEMKKLGFEINPDKGEFGVFFLQNRIFQSDGAMVMVYPWTRVLKSILFKETSTGLGPYGWLVALYQQLNKLLEYKPAFRAVVEIIKPYDNYSLGARDSVEYILSMVALEDQEAEEKGQMTSTAARLYDGDPTKSDQFTGIGSDIGLNPSFIEKVHRAVVEVVLG